MFIDYLIWVEVCTRQSTGQSFEWYDHVFTVNNTKVMVVDMFSVNNTKVINGSRHVFTVNNTTVMVADMFSQ